MKRLMKTNAQEDQKGVRKGQIDTIFGHKLVGVSNSDALSTLWDLFSCLKKGVI